MEIEYKYPLTEKEFEQMSADYELFRYGAMISDDIFFKLDIINETAVFLGSNLKYFKNRTVIKDYINLLNEKSIIHPDDKALFDETIVNLPQGIASPIKFRLMGKDGTSVWYNAQYVIVKDQNNVLIYAIGKLNNIQEKQELANKANQDLLTSCLNKITFETYSKSLMSEKNVNFSSQHVFIIIDIDNFKTVNDNLGHFFGDIVLKEIATKLKRIFREDDYIGRIGGDEFAVVMKNVESGQVILKKVKAILEEVASTYQGNGREYHISASIGISLYPRHGSNYEKIYQNADIALYHSKHKGKNTYTIYDEDLKKGTMANTTPFDVATRALAHYFDKETAMDTFNLLFEDDNHETSIMSVLRHIGETFNVDRCYIFEQSEESNNIYDNTHEWCREGIDPQIDFLQGVTVDIFEELFANANEDGVYYCNDLSTVANSETQETLAKQGIKSILHTYIKKNDLVKCVVGFDDCTSARIWTPREISTLMYSSKIIAQFLAYRRAVVTMEKKSKENLQVLDSLNFFAYIVDAKDRTLKYLNDLTKKIVPEAKIGDKCYEVLRGYKTECEDCPLKVLDSNDKYSKVKMFIRNDKLDLDVLVTASKLISYDGRESVFVSSTDVKELIGLIPKDELDKTNLIVAE